MIVVDASLALKWQLRDEPDLAPADDILRDAVDQKVELIAPDLWLYEVLNGLRTAVSRGRLSSDQAATAVSDYLVLGIGLHPFGPIATRANELAISYGLAIYDSAYLALAESVGADLYTADRPFFERTRVSVGFVKWFGEYHS